MRCIRVLNLLRCYRTGLCTANYFEDDMKITDRLHLPLVYVYANKCLLSEKAANAAYL